MKAGGNRGSEIYYLKFKDVEKLNDTKWLITFKTEKQHTTTTKQADQSLIMGEHEINIINQYLKCFQNEPQPEDRFFRKILPNMTASKQPIGKNTLRHYGIDIANYLGLKNPETYKGHCWRRTSVNILNQKNWDHGRILSTVTRHSNPATLSTYTATSIVEKERAAIDLAVGTKRKADNITCDDQMQEEQLTATSKYRQTVSYDYNKNNSLSQIIPLTQQNRQERTITSRAHVVLNISNSTINAPIYFHPHQPKHHDNYNSNSCESDENHNQS